MHIRRRGSLSFAMAWLMAVTVLTGTVFAQKNDGKLEKAQREEIAAVLGIADAVTAGKVAPSDITMTFSADYMKTQENRTFAAFTLTIPATPAPPAALTAYVRLMSKATEAPVPAGASGKAVQDKRAMGPVFEDVYPVDLKAPTPGQPYRLSRSFAVPAGEYDLLIVLKERAPIENDKKVKNPVYKTGVLRQPLTVPNFWTSDLTLSSIVVAERVEPLTVPLTREEAKEQPYTFGMTKITPAPSMTFATSGEISVVFFVYNAVLDENKKPDVSVEYGFYQVAEADKSETFFNRTSPLNFNVRTLPAQFNPELGYEVFAGQSVPLGRFPEGQYRLEITVADNLAHKTIVRSILFSVGS